MVNLSKSKYGGLWQCPKIAWMRKYKPKELVIDERTQARIDADIKYYENHSFGFEFSELDRFTYQLDIETCNTVNY